MSEIQQYGAPEGSNEKRLSVTGLAEKAPANEATGLAVVEQGHVIPTTGERKVTTRWEYWSYCLYSK